MPSRPTDSRDSPAVAADSSPPNKRAGRYVERIGINYGPSPAGFVRSRLASTGDEACTPHSGWWPHWPAPAYPAVRSRECETDPGRPGEGRECPTPKPVASRITDVTVYRGQALVTREVTVPEGDGTVELVVTPMPAQTVEGSLYTEGADGLGVLSTRFRTRAVKEDTRQEVRREQAELDRLQAETLRLQEEISVQEEDLKYLQKLEGFTDRASTA